MAQVVEVSLSVARQLLQNLMATLTKLKEHGGLQALHMTDRAKAQAYLFFDHVERSRLRVMSAMEEGAPSGVVALPSWLFLVLDTRVVVHRRVGAHKIGTGADQKRIVEPGSFATVTAIAPGGVRVTYDEDGMVTDLSWYQIRQFTIEALEVPVTTRATLELLNPRAVTSPTLLLLGD